MATGFVAIYLAGVVLVLRRPPRGFEGWAADLGRAVVVVAWPVAVVVALVVFARAMVQSDPESTIKRNPHGRA